MEAGAAYAKLWLDPLSYAHSHGFNAKEMTEIRKLVVSNQRKCLEAWDEFFSRKG